MKRHPTLAHLSRDHHPALILAQLLKRNAPDYKGLPQSTADKVEYAIKFYQEELLDHFKQEEEMMKLLTGTAPELDEIMERTRSEHVLLRNIFIGLATEADTISAMNTLANTLEKHIRAEERELFPLIESTCDEQTMAAIETILTR